MDRAFLQAERRGDVGSESNALVDAAEQCLDVDDLGLDLDNDEDPSASVAFADDLAEFDPAGGS